MKAVVLAGGEGTRLKPLTYKRPKPLMPVAGRPCIDYVIRSLVASGFQEIITTTAYLSDTLIKSIGDGLDYNASILYSFEATAAGTAGAVRSVPPTLSSVNARIGGGASIDAVPVPVLNTTTMPSKVPVAMLTGSKPFGVASSHSSAR